MRLVTLMENTPGKHRGLYTEHGLSFYLESEHTRLMFDFGESGHVWDNAQKLNIHLDALDMAVCSHAHYDHAAGLQAILPRMQLKTLVTGQGFWQEKYSSDGRKFSYLGPGYGREFLAKYGVQHKVCTDVLQLTPDCWAVTGFPHPHAWENIPDRFVLQTGPETFVPDRFTDEVCLAVQAKDGLAVIVGCSHPGVVNMLTTVQEKLGQPVTSVWGGAHLMEAEGPRVENTARAFAALGLKRVGLCHCSGGQLDNVASFIPDIPCVRIGTGDTVFL